MSTEKKIEKSTIIINGKKVPFYKIPAGMSGLGVDVQKEDRVITSEDEELEEKEVLIDLSETFKENPEFEQTLNKYFDEGELNNDLDEYIRNKMSPSTDLVDLFGKAY